MNRSLSLAACAAALATWTPAQIATPGKLIGFTANGSTNTASVTDQVLCLAPNSCPSPLPPPPQPWAGGSAYNGINTSVWHTQGTRLAETEINTCRLLCSVSANLTLGPNSLASGLALSEAHRELFQLETVAGAAAITTFHIRSCPPPVLRTCRFPLPSNTMMAGGLAYDKQNDLLLVAVSDWAATVANNVILVFRRLDPNCATIVCRIPVPACATTRLGPIRGLAFDCCDRLAYATDGRQTSVLRVDYANCAASSVACCVLNHPTGELWAGLDVEPIHAREVGRSCTGPNCPNCAAMRLSAVGDPVLGNPDFAVRLDDGPGGGVSVCFISPGACQLPGLPILCGLIHLPVPPPPLLLGISGILGIGCNGTATHPAPIPVDVSLCRGRACIQSIVVCLSAVTPGLALTNAVDVTFD